MMMIPEFEMCFDTALEGVPFEDGLDNTMAYLDWYRLVLSMTGAENPDGWHELFDRGLEFLNGRDEASGISDGATVYCGYGITRAAGDFGLRGFPFFCFLMAIAQEMEARLNSMFLSPSGEGCSLLLAAEVYSRVVDGPDFLADVDQMRSCPLFVFFPGKPGSGSMGDNFCVNREAAAIIRGNYGIPAELVSICRDETGKGREAGNINIFSAQFDMADRYLSSRTNGRSCLLQIIGSEGSGREGFALRSLEAGTPATVVSLGRLLARPDAEILSDEILVRCRALGHTLIIRDVPKDDDTARIMIEHWISRLDIVYVIVSERLEKIPCEIFSVKLPSPRTRERELLWEEAFSGFDLAEDVSLKELSRKYVLNPGDIRACGERAEKIAVSEGRSEISAGIITQAVLEGSTKKLDALCDRIPLAFSLEDLVVGDNERRLIETLIKRVKYRSQVDEEWGFDEKIPYGKGVSMILYGPPGTGKTMTAQVMAKEIGMALYRVDLSQMVDKYIGETQKNISRVFDAARDGNVILFFDEADALFSKRTEVANSNDRHANSEVAFLLQKIEQHNGVTFLATNRFNDFDQAFLRRITYAVRLERPDAGRRLQLFEQIFPQKAPREKGLDLKFFADKFELSGSEIKEAIYSAAFIAAGEEAPIGNRHLAMAIKYQQEKTGKLISDTAFGPYAYHVE